MPAAPDDAAAWREEVIAFREAERRRVFPARVSVGLPAAARVGLEVPWPEPAEYDDGLRLDLLDALLGRWTHQHGGAGWAWVRRPGVPELHDLDQAWHAAARRAFAAREVPLLGFRVVTRTGWLDVVSGERRAWRRPRRRGRAATD